MSLKPTIHSVKKKDYKPENNGRFSYFKSTIFLRIKGQFLHEKFANKRQIKKPMN